MFPNWERGSDGWISTYMTGAAEQKHDLCVMKEVGTLSKAGPNRKICLSAYEDGYLLGFPGSVFFLFCFLPNNSYVLTQEFSHTTFSAQLRHSAHSFCGKREHSDDKEQRMCGDRREMKCRENKTVAAVFLSLTDLGTSDVCVTVSPGCFWNIYLDLDILTHSDHLKYTSTSFTVYSCKSTQTHSLLLLPQRQAINVSVSPQQFSFNGTPDSLLFSSVILVWPLAQSLSQLCAKTEDLLPLSGGRGCKEEENRRMPWAISPKFWFSVLFKFSSTVLHLAVLTKWTVPAVVVCLLWLSLLLLLLLLFLVAPVIEICMGVVFRLTAFIHHIYWLPFHCCCFD